MNNGDITAPADLVESAGGTKEKCEKIITNTGQNVEHSSSPSVGEEMVNQTYELKNEYVCYPKFDPKNAYGQNILDPSKTSFADIERHALTVQKYLASTTVISRKLLLRKMEIHPICRVDFKSPSWQNFFDYMNCIKEHGDTDRNGNLKPITRNALRNRTKAWKMCMIAWGVDDTWKKFKVKKVPNRTRPIVLPSPNKYMNSLHINTLKTETSIAIYNTFSSLDSSLV